MSSAPVLHSLDERGVATVTLNRPEVGNAYNGDLIQGLLSAMDALSARLELRVVLLRGNGKHFPSRRRPGMGALDRPRLDGGEHRRQPRHGRGRRPPQPPARADGGACAGRLLRRRHRHRCRLRRGDRADNALFSITEVRWGLTAASSFPSSATPSRVRQLRRYALTGERFGATEAQRIGLAHLVVPAERLAAAGEEMVVRLLENGPTAMAETKATTLQSAWGGFDRQTFDALVEAHARKRQTAEAAEGLASFAEKRAARWSRR
jgi:methylglutaconyl-CoA hydratase